MLNLQLHCHSEPHKVGNQPAYVEDTTGVALRAEVHLLEGSMREHACYTGKKSQRSPVEVMTFTRP